MNKLRYIFFFLVSSITACSNEHNTNKLDSDDFANHMVRVEKLKNEIKTYSDFTDAEFELFNVNGFKGSRISIPGASSLDYKFAIKLAPEDIHKWTGGMDEVFPEAYDVSWTKEITAERNVNWKTSSAPSFFTRKEAEVMMLVYEREGILYKRVINN